MKTMMIKTMIKMMKTMMKTMIMMMMMAQRIPGCAVVDCEGGEPARSGAADYHCYHYFDYHHFDYHHFDGYYHYLSGGRVIISMRKAIGNDDHYHDDNCGGRELQGEINDDIDLIGSLAIYIMIMMIIVVVVVI